MFDWDDLRYLLAVHREGSLLAAGRRLRVDPTTVGRRIAALEHDLKAHLVARTAHGLALTALGQQVAAAAEHAEGSALEVERLVAAGDGVAAGRVRLTTLQDVADALILPLLPELKQRHPQVRVDLWCTERKLDLALGEADVAVRVGRPTEANAVTRRLCTLVERPHVARGWLEARGLRPQDVTDLDDREVLLLLVEDRWTEGLGRARPAMRATAMSTLIGAARAGMGIVMTPETLAGAFPELVPLPALPVARERDLWLVLPEALAAVPRVRVVADLLIERLGSLDAG
ncbi:MAG: LysR family transcriptional regulator [Myxococcota bacterium]